MSAVVPCLTRRAMQVTALRFKMYVVFILVPMGLIRQLACKAIILGDEDDENTDDVQDMLAKGGANMGGPGEGGVSLPEPPMLVRAVSPSQHTHTHTHTQRERERERERDKRTHARTHEFVFVDS